MGWSISDSPQQWECVDIPMKEWDDQVPHYGTGAD